MRQRMKRGVRETERAEKGQKTGKQEPYRGDSHPGTPQRLYRADNPPRYAGWRRTYIFILEAD